MFWGGKRNHLGNILMRVRAELCQQHQQAASQPEPKEDSDDDCPQKERVKGDPERQALFEEQLQAWMDADDGAALHELSEASSDGDAASGDRWALPLDFVTWLRPALDEELSKDGAELLWPTVE